MKNNFDISILDGLLSPNNTADANGQFMLPFYGGKGETLSPGDPWYEESQIDTGEEVEIIETEYMKRIKQCFADAYRFLEKHKHPRTEADWERITGSLPRYKDPLTIGLVCGCVEELEREYKKQKVNYK